RSIKIDPKHFSLKDINKVLIGLSVIASIFAVFYLAKESGFVKKRMSELRATPIKENSLSIDLGVDRPNASSYVTGTQKNNPFHLLPVEETAVEKKETETTDLKLVGILWSDSAQAIVEDPASAKTYMVYQGDMIENYKVEEITQTKVRLVSEYGEKILQ
ncbi:MAG: hypothetical protein KKG84_00520, partial [Candidatus Omnitrophica bacterium]|nr:hypothetical protein [Candidatus Omnitrophota bacterium]